MAASDPSHAQPYRRRIRAYLALFALILATLNCHAVPPDSWKSTAYSFRGSATSLGQLLVDFANAMGVQPRITPSLAAKAVRSSSPGVPATTYLDRLSTEFHFQWFVFNGVLYVTPNEGNVTERIKLGSLSASAAKEALIGVGIFESKFGWGGIDEQPPVALISGPLEYVRQVKELLISPEEEVDPDEPQLMVFKLKHAHAADRELRSHEGPQTQTGIASILRNIINNNSNRGSAGMRAHIASFNAPPQVSSTGNGAAAPPSPKTDSMTDLARPRSGGVSIEAFPAMNAVVVRDLPKRRKMYDDFIAELDVPAKQIEIKATIADVDSSELREWSADLSLRSGSSRVHFSTGNSATANVGLWVSDRIQLLLRSLESKGSAHVLSRPSVLTLDNTSAILDSTKTTHLQLIGERSVDLRPVTAGTTLKVTPRALGADGEAAIVITVEAEDGFFNDTGNDRSSPVTSRSGVKTTAIVRPNEALIIGGYSKFQTESNSGQVPLLSALPFVGALFRSEYGASNSRERVFIISARLIPLDGHATPDDRIPAKFQALMDAPLRLDLMMRRNHEDD